MPAELALPVAFLLGLGVVLAGTPLAMRLAIRTDFLDRPHSYKGHRSATPYLGGLALVAAVLTCATWAVGTRDDVPLLLVLGIVGACAVGTIDDRRNLGPWLRIVLVCALAIGLWAGGIGWNAFGAEGLNLTLTIFWVLAVVNAFNLMDNMDGAAATVTAAASSGVAILAELWDHTALAAVALGMCGACLAFLRFNLALPRARVFMGDGGSMPLGFAIAAIVMALSHTPQAPGQSFVVAALALVGVAALDTALVMVSRRRRGAPLWSGGRDHLTHRLHQRVGSPRAVAARLGAAQLVLSAVGIGIAHASPLVAAASGVAVVVIGTALIVLLDSPAWRSSWKHEAEGAAGPSTHGSVTIGA